MGHVLAISGLLVSGLWLQTDAQHCLLKQKKDLLASLLPCQLVTLPGDSMPSGQLSLESSLMIAETSPGHMLSVVPF